MDYIEGHEIGLSPYLVLDLAEWARVADARFKEASAALAHVAAGHTVGKVVVASV